MNDMDEINPEQVAALVEKDKVPDSISVMFDSLTGPLCVLIKDSQELQDVIAYAADREIDHMSGWVMVKASKQFDPADTWLRLEVDYMTDDSTHSLVSLLNLKDNATTLSLIANTGNVGFARSKEDVHELKILVVNDTSVEPIEIALGAMQHFEDERGDKD